MEELATDDRSRRYHRPGYGVAINFTHSKVAREKPPAPVEAPPIAAPTIARPPSPIGRLIATYDDVIDVFRARADELELSRLEIDRLSGLADGHSSHLLAKKYTQRLGPVSLLLMLDTLGLRLLVVEDPILTARTIKLRTPRCQSHLRVMRKLASST
jgi:hypothetical protein